MAQTPTQSAKEKSTEQKVLEWTVPINRSPWALAAGYVALFSFPFIILGPIAVALGIVGLNDAKKRQKRGKGRSIFAIVYGGIATFVLFWAIMFITTQ